LRRSAVTRWRTSTPTSWIAGSISVRCPRRSAWHGSGRPSSLAVRRPLLRQRVRPHRCRHVAQGPS
jgi:hypothetical protein